MYILATFELRKIKDFEVMYIQEASYKCYTKVSILYFQNIVCPEGILDVTFIYTLAYKS